MPFVITSQSPLVAFVQADDTWPPAYAWTGAESDDALRMLGAFDFVLEELGKGKVDRAAALREAMEEAEAAADEAAASVASAAALAAAARAPQPVSFALEDAVSVTSEGSAQQVLDGAMEDASAEQVPIAAEVPTTTASEAMVRVLSWVRK